jgi:hypothetical protein
VRVIDAGKRQRLTRVTCAGTWISHAFTVNANAHAFDRRVVDKFKQ